MTIASSPPNRQPRGAAAALLVLGVALTGAYALASTHIPLGRFFPAAGVSLGFPQLRGVPLPQAEGAQWERSAAEYVGLVVVTFALYALALLALRGRAVPPRWVLLGFPALFAAALLPMYPPTAADMFHYQAMGRVLWVFGANPLTTPAEAYPYPIGISWGHLPSPYGPLWSLLTAPAALLPGGERLLEGLYAFKALAAASYIGCAWLVWRLVTRTRPGHEAFALVLFAWNPFVLLRVVGNGHNDLWMMLFVLLALDRAERRAGTAALAMLTLSVLVKFASALLGPPLLLYLWIHTEGGTRGRFALLVRGGTVSLALVVLAYWPFWAGTATFDTLRGETAMMITSTPQLVEALLRQRLVDPAMATEPARRVMLAAFALVYVALTWQARRGFAGLLAACFGVLFAYLLLAAGWFRPWYLLWPVAILALRPGRWPTLTLLAITFCGALPDLVEQYRDHWPWIDSYTKFIAAPIVVAFALPALVWLVALTREGPDGSKNFAVRGAPGKPRYREACVSAAPLSRAAAGALHMPAVPAAPETGVATVAAVERPAPAPLAAPVRPVTRDALDATPTDDLSRLRADRYGPYRASVERGEDPRLPVDRGDRMTQESDGNAPGIPPLEGTIEELPSGLRYIDEVVGEGELPSRGQQVIVEYTGWLTDGSSFDSSRGRGPFDFAIGTGAVIRGWDEGVASMQVGGRRRLIIPAAMGYGARGYPPVIPEDATLIFDVELLGLG